MKIIFFDTETTGIKSKHLIQLAYTVYDEDFKLIKEFNKKIKTEHPIEIGAMAVHHITDENLKENGIEFETIKKEVQEDFSGAILIAHNVEYDYQVMTQAGLDIDANKLMDTYKLAYSIDHNPELYSLQYLRYFYKIYESRIKIVPHDAMSDVVVLEEVFHKLLNIYSGGNVIDQDIIDEFINITKNPLILRYWRFGKYKNLTFEDTAAEDIGYLEWAYNKLILPKVKSGEDYDKNLKYTLEYYLGKL